MDDPDVVAGLEKEGRAVVNGRVEEPSSASMEVKGASEATKQALFWPSGFASDMVWHVPPIGLSPEERARQEALLNQLEGHCRDFPRRFWLLRWNYWTRAVAATEEQRAVEHEVQELLEQLKAENAKEQARLAKQIELLREREAELRIELLQERRRFAESVGRAGLRLPDGLLKQEMASQGGEQRPSAAVEPRKVIEALEEIPDLDEIAGEHGVRPEEQKGFFALLLNMFMQILAPLVAGLLLALCLGTLVGLLDLDTLLRADGLPRLGVAAALGFVIVYLMGEIYHAVVGMLSRSLEAYDSAVRVPRLHKQTTIAVLCLVGALVLGLAEVTAEGMGLRMLHHQQILREERVQDRRSDQDHEMPLPIYMLIGLLISGPYLLYKSTKGWSEVEEQMRRAWLRHQQRAVMEARSKDPVVQELLQHAYALEGMEKTLQELRTELADMEQQRLNLSTPTLPSVVSERRQAARAAAVGEATRLQQMLENLVGAMEPLPEQPEIAKPAPASRNGFLAGRW
ncbi:hypothetical protein [Chthonomonas calidirosea]|uniref:hypothetical protein n=1 Tax=Chthonomonas calidirosea TaxID=454171 RepID=UPI0006EC68D8|nr:hypothetical protein [Chthonomonas calidirosea]CEK12687.1 hypothetical protein CP488_00151 [Chthonomonas calidirosea]